MWLNSHAINLMNQQRSNSRTPLTPNGLIPNQEGWYVFVSLAAMRKAADQLVSFFVSLRVRKKRTTTVATATHATSRAAASKIRTRAVRSACPACSSARTAPAPTTTCSAARAWAASSPRSSGRSRPSAVRSTAGVCPGTLSSRSGQRRLASAPIRSIRAPGPSRTAPPISCVASREPSVRPAPTVVEPLNKTKTGIGS